MNKCDHWLGVDIEDGSCIWTDTKPSWIEHCEKKMEAKSYSGECKTAEEQLRREFIMFDYCPYCGEKL